MEPHNIETPQVCFTNLHYSDIMSPCMYASVYLSGTFKFRTAEVVEYGINRGMVLY